MAGLVFPDLVGTLSRVAGMEHAQAQRDFMDEDRKAKASASPFVAKALQGDSAAINEVATRHPETAMKLAPLLERLDAGQRARAKEASEYTVQAGMAILNAPPDQQPQLYAQARQDAQARGLDVSKWPTQYNPGWVKFNVDKALPVAEHFKRQSEAPVAVGPAGGGAPAAPVPTDDLGRARGAIAGIESAGQPNGGYGAVGPDAGKGNRAYGKYQIMDFNIGPWTQEILGKSMTPQEFLANPQAQDAVFNAKFGQYITQYGSPEAASRAWFAGPGGMNNAGAKDVLGTTVADYSKKFTAGMGAPGPQVAQGDNTQADGSGNAIPPAQPQINGYAARDLTAALPPGARFVTRGGKYNIQNDIAEIMHPDGSLGLVRLPPKKEQSGGPFAGTSTEAQALNMLIANGTLTRQQAAELAAGKTITNPADGSVLFMTPSGIFQRPAGGAAPGAAPAAAPNAAPAPTQAPATPPSGMIPITAPKPEKMTEGQANAALYADRMKAAELIIAGNESAGLDPKGKALEQVPLGNYLQSESYQKLEQARRDFINAVLRRESGAVISDAEFLNAEKQYFPRPGDKPDTLKQKADNRRVAIEGISRAAGPTYTKDQPKLAAKGVYTGPDNAPVSWQEIEATAKNRGISTDEVISKLGLRPTGMQ